MARPSVLVSSLRALEGEIEAWLAATRGGPRLREDLYREIWDVLTGAGAFDQVRACSRRASGLATRIEQRVHKRRGDALGKAVLEHTHFGATQASACRRWKVHASEWRYVAELAEFLGEQVRPGLPLRTWPGGWLSEVEEHHEEVAVLVEDQALQDMVLGALEAYSVPKGRGNRYTEVYGVCFGSLKAEERKARGWGRRQLLHVLVRRVALQLRALTTSTYTVRSARSQSVHLAMAHDLFPHLDLVGDFHSHPYDTLEELRESGGWNYTASDEDDNRAWVGGLAEAGYRPRVGLILALARASRAGRGEGPAPNVLRAMVGRCHCYLAAYRINRDGSYSAEDVSLRCPAVTGLGGR